MHTKISRDLPVMFALRMYRLCRCGKAVGLPHSDGRTPVKLTDLKYKLLIWGSEVLEAQNGGNGPVMGTLIKDKLVSDGNAPSSDHVVGNMPGQQQNLQVTPDELMCESVACYVM